MDLFLGYFRQINTLGFISYSVVLCNSSHIHSEALSFTRGFSPQGFPRKSSVYFFVSYFIIMPLISTSGIRAFNFFPISSMATMKYEIPLLDRSTRFSLWQVNMCDVLMQMDLDDALLGFDIVEKRGETTLRIVKPYLRFTFIY